MLNQNAVDNPTLPVNLRFHHLVEILAECQAVLWDCRAATIAKHLGHAWFFGKRFFKSNGVFFSTLSARVQSLDF